MIDLLGPRNPGGALAVVGNQSFLSVEKIKLSLKLQEALRRRIIVGHKIGIGGCRRETKDSWARRYRSVSVGQAFGGCGLRHSSRRMGLVRIAKDAMANLYLVGVC